MKVVLLCHVSNASIREKLPLSSRKIHSLFNKLIGRPKLDYSDFANWNVKTIEGLKNEKNVELHVVSPHYGLSQWLYEYNENGVEYHFYRPEPLFPWNVIEKIFNKNQYIKYPRTRKIVKSVIDRIHPDIVNLVGAENPYYSICGLDIENTPLFITCQTIYSNPNRKTMSGNVSEMRWNLEQALFKKANAFSCYNLLYRDLIRSYVSSAIIFPLIWPESPFPQLKPCEKKYDFAFFSVRVSNKKGIDSAIDSLAIVKKRKHNVTLLVVGHADMDIMEDLHRKIKDNNLVDNVIFHDFFPLQVDMFNFVNQARFALLPVKLDFISGTILQAFEMGMPVVTHITTGTPTLNAERETVLLSEIGDVNTMAEQMLRLMDDEQMAQRLSKNGKVYMDMIHERSSNSIQILLNQYKATIEYYRNGTPIPSEMLEFI